MIKIMKCSWFIGLLFLPGCLLFNRKPDQPVRAFASQVERTICASGCNHSTIQDWADSLASTLIYTSGDTAVGVIAKTETFTEDITISLGGGFTTAQLITADSVRHDGTDSGAQIITSTNGLVSTVTISRNDVWLEGLNIRGGSAQRFVYLVSFSGGITGIRITESVFINNDADGRVRGVGGGTIATDALIANNFFWTEDGGSGDRSAIHVSRNSDVINNTILSWSDGSGATDVIEFFGSSTGNGCTIKNNISMGNTGTAQDFPTSVSGTLTEWAYNMSEDSTADDLGSTGALLGKTVSNQFTSTTSGSEDLHLKTGSDGIDAGDDGNCPVTSDIDIDGETHDSGSSREIGGDKFTEAAGGGGGGNNLLQIIQAKPDSTIYLAKK